MPNRTASRSGPVALARRIAATILGRPSVHQRRTRAAVARNGAFLRSLGDADKAWVMRLVRETLSALTANREPTRGTGAPATLARGGGPFEVLCTLRRDGRSVARSSAVARGLPDAVVKAVSSAWNELGSEALSAPSGAAGLDVELSLLGHWVRLPRVPPPQLRQLIGLGIHAIRLEVDGKVATIPAALPIRLGYDLEQTLDRLGADAGTGSASWLFSQAELSVAPELHLIQSEGERGFIELSRGLLREPPQPATRDALERSLRSGVEWLVRNQREDGLYDYRFEPHRALFADSDDSIRQAGTAFGVAAVGSHLGERSHDDSARRCIDRLLSMTEYADSARHLPYMRYPGSADLGLTGLTLLAILHLESPDPYADTIQGFARSIMALQDPSGELRSDFTEPLVYIGQGYFPGEALFALSVLYEQTRAEDLRRCIERAFDYYPRAWRSFRNTAFVPWQTHVAFHMHRATGEARYAEFVFEMNDWMLGSAWTEGNAPYLDYVGGFGPGTPTVSTGSQMEAITEAYSMAAEIGDGRRADRYRAAIVRAASFLLRLQFKQEEAQYLAAEKRSCAVGGYRLSLTDHALRIDAAQHSMIALLNMLRLVDATPWSTDGRG